MKNKILFIILISGMLSFTNAQRIKDIAYIKGSMKEQLIGYGLVVGLAGTGDSYRSSFTIQSVTSMLKRFGITVPDVNLRMRNVAAVMVTASVDNYLRNGSEFDIVVSSMGDATSLLGGTLLLTPLSGKDGNVYATAQGPVSVGGYDIYTASGDRMAKNHSASGRVPNGAIMQQEFADKNTNANELSIVLKSPDYTTANNITQAINNQFGSGTATSLGPSEINVKVPPNNQNDLTNFIAELEKLQVQIDMIAKVVLNERTGTVVAGQNVRISPVSISHGNLRINIRSYPIVSQPNSFSQGETIFFNQLEPTVESDSNNVVTINGASNVQEITAALNSLKVSPRDIIAIFQALKEAGALVAELIII